MGNIPVLDKRGCQIRIMSQEGILNIGSLNGSSIEATMWFGPMRAKECSIWLLHLLDHPNFLERCSFKQNTHGRVKLKLVLRKRSDWQQLVEDTKLKVLSLTTKAENLNGG
jgi:hypothetical protein